MWLGGCVPLAFRRRLWAATADAALPSAVMARHALLARRIDQPTWKLKVIDLIGHGFYALRSASHGCWWMSRMRQPRVVKADHSTLVQCLHRYSSPARSTR